MHVIRGLHNLTASHRGCVATIGNFDGVHRGHQAILQQCREHAARLNVPLTVVVFEPQPREFFAGDQAPPRLTRLREKVRLLRDHGAEQVLEAVDVIEGQVAQEGREGLFHQRLPAAEHVQVRDAAAAAGGVGTGAAGRGAASG